MKTYLFYIGVVVIVGLIVVFLLTKPFDPDKLIDVSEAVDAARKAAMQKEIDEATFPANDASTEVPDAGISDAGVVDTWDWSDAGMRQRELIIQIVMDIHDLQVDRQRYKRLYEACKKQKRNGRQD